MKKGIWQLTVRAEFAAAHALRHYQGACESMHGHNYKVEMAVEGEALTPDTELLMDFTELKKILTIELEVLDHKCLNQVEPFTHLNPSSENLAKYLWYQLTPYFVNKPAKIKSVSVSENSRQTATYWEIEE